MTKQDEIKKFLKERSLSTDVGTAKRACSIASINLALGNGLTEDVPETVSPVITHWLMLSQDIMSDRQRDTKLKKLLPSLIDTDNGNDDKRIKILRYWVFNKLAKQMEDKFDEIGALPEYKNALRLKSKRSFKKVEEKLASNVYVYGNYIDLLNIIANEKDNIAVARKVGIVAAYADDKKWLDEEMIKLLRKLIKS